MTFGFGGGRAGGRTPVVPTGTGFGGRIAPDSSGYSAQRENEQEDNFSSPPGLWLPRTVVKKDRKKATVVWVVLLVGFLAYVAYIVRETVESRKDPASSIELKQEYYMFPDVAICTSYLAGCLSPDNDCLYFDPYVYDLQGFEEDDDDSDFVEDNADSRLHIIEAFPYCRVVPFSRLTVNETGVISGDITSLHASFFMMWDEDLDAEFESVVVNNQYVQVYFIDVDETAENIGTTIVDAKIPYARVNLTDGVEFTATVNHMVLGLTEFTGINANGQKQERQRTFSQSTTSAPQNWLWKTEYSGTSRLAFLVVEMAIGKFEYTVIEEVDPVDAWSIMGAIGGIWQFVVTGFGLFVVFSSKQAPDKKMRNFHKTINKPVDVVRRLSLATSGHSSVSGKEDAIIDASEDDLPAGWVKRAPADGRAPYYHNLSTGEMQAHPPNVLGIPAGGDPQPRRNGLINVGFKPAHESVARASAAGTSSQDTSQASGRRAPIDVGPLPPDWVATKDDREKIYYVHLPTRKSQWERPTTSSVDVSGASVHASRRQPRMDPNPQRRNSNASSVSHTPSASTDLPRHSGTGAGSFDSATRPPSADGPAPSLRNTGPTPSYNSAVRMGRRLRGAAAVEGGDGTHGGGGGGAAAAVGEERPSSGLPPARGRRSG